MEGLWLQQLLAPTIKILSKKNIWRLRNTNNDLCICLKHFDYCSHCRYEQAYINGAFSCLPHFHKCLKGKGLSTSLWINSKFLNTWSRKFNMAQLANVSDNETRFLVKSKFFILCIYKFFLHL